MMKNEYVFTIMVGEPKIGEGIVLKLSDGRIVRTSRVVDYFVWRNGDIVIQNGGIGEVEHGCQLQTGKRYRR